MDVVVKYSKGKYSCSGVDYFSYAFYGMDILVRGMYKEYRRVSA